MQKAKRVIGRSEVLARVGVSYVTIWNWMQQNRFPRSRELGDLKVCWLEEEIDEWINNLPVKRLKGDPEQNGEEAGSDIASAGEQLGKRDNPASLDRQHEPVAGAIPLRRSRGALVHKNKGRPPDQQ